MTLGTPRHGVRGRESSHEQAAERAGARIEFDRPAMCLTAPARVLSVGDGVALVDLDGRRRPALLAITPEVAPGDWVIVGAGTVLRRLDPSEPAGIGADIDAARAAAGSSPTPRPEGDLR